MGPPAHSLPLTLLWLTLSSPTWPCSLTLWLAAMGHLFKELLKPRLLTTLSASLNPAMSYTPHVSLFSHHCPCARSLRDKGFRGLTSSSTHLLSDPQGLQASLTQFCRSQFLSHPLLPHSFRCFLNLGLPCVPQSAHSSGEGPAHRPSGQRRKPPHSAWETEECHTLLQGLLSWGRDPREIYSPKLYPVQSWKPSNASRSTFNLSLLPHSPSNSPIRAAPH